MFANLAVDIQFQAHASAVEQSGQQWVVPSICTSNPNSILLIAGGDKSTQAKDIAKALELNRNYVE